MVCECAWLVSGSSGVFYAAVVPRQPHAWQQLAGHVAALQCHKLLQAARNTRAPLQGVLLKHARTH